MTSHTQRRVIIVSEFHRGSTSWELTEGLASLGWDVHILDLRNYLTSWRAKGLRAIRRVLTPYIIRSMHAELAGLNESIRPTHILNLKGAYFSTELISVLKGGGAKVVMFYPDFHFEHDGVVPESFPYYDGISTTKSFQLPYLRQHCPNARIAFIPHGYSDTIHKPLKVKSEEADYDADIGYVGNYSPYKEAWLDAVAEAFPTVKMRIVGSVWAKKCRSPRLKSAIYGDVLYGTSFVRSIQSSKINIAVHMGPHANGWQDLTSTRTFEIPACKGFMLHIDNPEVRALYDVGTEIDVFSSPGELIDRIRQYLPLAEKRRSMIEAAYGRTVPAYGLRARAKILSDFLDKIHNEESL